MNKRDLRIKTSFRPLWLKWYSFWLFYRLLRSYGNGRITAVRKAITAHYWRVYIYPAYIREAMHDEKA